jgi:hypothetical protein
MTMFMATVTVFRGAPGCHPRGEVAPPERTRFRNTWILDFSTYAIESRFRPNL